MFNDKDYLLLCELIRTGVLNAQHSGSFMEVVDAHLGSPLC